MPCIAARYRRHLTPRDAQHHDYARLADHPAQSPPREPGAGGRQLLRLDDLDVARAVGADCIGPADGPGGQEVGLLAQRVSTRPPSSRV